MKHLLAGAMAAVLLAGCSDGNPFVDGDGDGDGGSTLPSDIPEAILSDLGDFTYDPVAQTLTITGLTLDAAPITATYTRNSDLDRVGYEAYTTQASPLDRHATAYVKQINATRAVVVVTGGQFGNYFGGAAYTRTGGYSPATGLASYGGSYVGLFNAAGSGEDLLPVDPSVPVELRPTQAAEVTGTVLFNADFGDNTVNGRITDRVLVDAPGIVLEDLDLAPTPIESNGAFAGNVEQGSQSRGTYAGIFGGPGANEVAGALFASNHVASTMDEEEFGIFVLEKCELTSNPACNNRFRLFLLVACLGLGAALCAGAPARAAETPPRTVELSLQDVRDLAVQALRKGDFETAIQLSRALLQVDAEDPVAYFVLSMAHGSLGDATLSRKAAGYAFQYATAREDKFRAGQLAAQAAVSENRLSLAQFWLRRAAIHADTAEEQEIIARDYRTLRRLNPWSLRVGFALRPSSNVNNGSEDALQIIDGVPVRFSGSAQALSGLIATLDVSSSYRLSVSDVSATHLGARLYTRQVALSDSAKDKAPELRNSDLSQYYVEAAVSHRRQVNQGVIGGIFALGQSWFGNEPTYRFARLSGDRVWSRDSGAWFSLGASVEERQGVDGPRFDATAISLTLRAGQQLQNGDDMVFTLGLRDTDARFVNDTNQSVSLRAAYEFAEAMGPAKVGLALTLGYSDYDQFFVGSLILPGGRQDKSAYADVNLTFEDLDYAGFAPRLRIRLGGTSSTFSRFDTREFSVGLGIESKF